MTAISTMAVGQFLIGANHGSCRATAAFPSGQDAVCLIGSNSPSWGHVVPDPVQINSYDLSACQALLVKDNSTIDLCAREPRQHLVLSGLGCFFQQTASGPAASNLKSHRGI